MSRVFLAHETALGRNVVVKVLSSDVVAGISAERFAREVRLAASLQHPNIVPVLTTGIADGIPYYTMPYVRGESLRTRMKEGAVPLRSAISILRDLARALQYAHLEGVIHRDIKPENILLSGDVAVVTDFGIAKAISLARTSNPDHADINTLTQAGSTVGTPAYMAPEQVSGDNTIDNRADLYSWGIVAYELLAGVHPFFGKPSLQHLFVAQLTETPAPLNEKASGIPPALTDLVMRTLKKAPGDRPASASEILDALDTPFDSRDPIAVPMPMPQIEVVKPRRNITLPLILVGVAAVAIGAYAFFVRPSQSASVVNKSSVAVLPFADEGADSAAARTRTSLRYRMTLPDPSSPRCGLSSRVTAL